jgi:hypothetical protein
MTFALRAWTADDSGLDQEISQSIYPEYQQDLAILRGSQPNNSWRLMRLLPATLSGKPPGTGAWPMPPYGS